jgi:hypothetical protein
MNATWFESDLGFEKKEGNRVGGLEDEISS